jgi:site-specific recombinase XerD
VNSERAEFSIKRNIEERLWDNGKMKGNGEEAKKFNMYLKEIEGKIFEHYRDLLVLNEPITAEELKNRYFGITQEKEEDKGVSLLELMEYHNSELKDTLEWGTMKNYITTQKYVQLFLTEKLKVNDIFLTELKHRFIYDFEMFVKAYQPLDHHKPCGQNTVMKHIERLRKMINVAIRNEWLEKDPFIKFKPTFTKSTREYLALEELTAIEEKEFSIERLKHVKDLFIFSCYTGLAYIDMMKLTPENITQSLSGKSWLNTSRQKTDNPVRIPLMPKALEIIESYKSHPKAVADGTLFPNISNQKLNSYLKEIADVCGIKKNLTFHLARHTFATTVTLTNGMPIETVSKLLGHSSIRTTQIYAKVVEKKVEEDMDALISKLDKKSNTNKEYKTGS